jgi:hypothetical protein
MCKDYPDDIYLNDGTVLTITVDGDIDKLFEVLGIEVVKKDDALEELKDACETVTDAIKTINRIITETISVQTGEPETHDVKDPETTDLKAACDVIERYNTCYNAPTAACLNENCIDRSCSECKYHTDPDTVQKAVDVLLDHAKKSLNGCEEVDNRYIRDVTGGVELLDDSGDFVGYVHGFKGVKSEADIRSIVEKSWGLLTLNPFTLEKIIEDHGYVSDIHFIVEIYKDPGDIKLPEQWRLIKRKAKEDSR